MKEIYYYGITLTVPEWANYVALDGDGEIYAYENEPAYEVWDYEEPAYWLAPGRNLLVGHVNPDIFKLRLN